MYLVAKVHKVHKDSTKLIQRAQLTLKKRHHLVVEDLPIPHDYKLLPYAKDITLSPRVIEVAKHCFFKNR
jgi:hypothetical protein